MGSQMDAKLHKKTDQYEYCSLDYPWYSLWLNNGKRAFSQSDLTCSWQITSIRSKSTVGSRICECSIIPPLKTTQILRVMWWYSDTDTTKEYSQSFLLRTQELMQVDANECLTIYRLLSMWTLRSRLEFGMTPSMTWSWADTSLDTALERLQ
jgi:hypothetical protein